MEIRGKSTREPSSRKKKYAIVAVSIVAVILCSSALYMYYSRPHLQIVSGASGHMFSLTEPDCWMEITVENSGRSAGTGILYAELELMNELPGNLTRHFVCGGSTYVTLEAGEQRVFVVQIYIPETYYDLDLLNNHTLFGDFHAYLVTL
jgi:hypothetical protein